MKLTDALERWECSTERAFRTRESYRRDVRRLTKAGFRKVSDVTPERLAEYVRGRLGAVRPASINRELAGLYAALGCLERASEFPEALLRQLRRQKVPVKAKRRLGATFLKPDERARLIEAAKARSAWVGVMVQLAIYSGMRAGELCRLRWQDVRLDDRPEIRVRFLPEIGEHGTLKTGERVVPVCRELKAALLEWKLATGGEGYLFRLTSPQATVAFRRVRHIRRELRAVRKTADLEWVTFHVLRHTRATMWAMSGVPLIKVSCWLGHSLQVCQAFYLGLLEGYDPDCERAA